MNAPTNNFNYLWNDLPKDERARLMPHMIESQILHLWQCKSIAIRSHKTHIAELNEQIKNLEKLLPSNKD